MSDDTSREGAGTSLIGEFVNIFFIPQNAVRLVIVGAIFASANYCKYLTPHHKLIVALLHTGIICLFVSAYIVVRFYVYPTLNLAKCSFFRFCKRIWGFLDNEYQGGRKQVAESRQDFNKSREAAKKVARFDSVLQRARDAVKEALKSDVHQDWQAIASTLSLLMVPGDELSTEMSTQERNALGKAYDVAFTLAKRQLPVPAQSVNKPNLTSISDATGLPVQVASDVVSASRPAISDSTTDEKRALLTEMEREVIENGLAVIECLFIGLSSGARQDFLLAATRMFVYEAQEKLTSRAYWFLACGVMVVLSLAMFLGVAIYKATDHLEHLNSDHSKFAPSTQWIVLDLFATLAYSGLIFVVIKGLLALARACFHEGTALFDRRHALRFGKLYVHLFHEKLVFEELKEAFQWNRESKTAFQDVKVTEIADTPLNKLVQAASDNMGQIMTEGIKRIAAEGTKTPTTTEKPSEKKA